MFQEQYRQFIAEVLEEAKVLLKEMRPPFDRPHVFDDDYVNEWFAIRPDNRILSLWLRISPMMIIFTVSFISLFYDL